MGADRPAGAAGMLAHSSYVHDPRIRRAAETLARAGWRVDVVGLRNPARGDAPPEPARETLNGVEVHRLPLVQKRGGLPRYALEFGAVTALGAAVLTALHLRRPFDVVHLHNMPDLLMLAGLPARALGAVTVLDVHDPMSELFQSRREVGPGHPLIRLIRAQERACYRLADHLMTVSVPMAENIAAKSGRPLEEVVVVHNAPDVGAFPLAPPEPPWPRHAGSMVLVYAGTVTEHYRLDVAVRALALALPDVPGLRLRILGEGTRLHRILGLARTLGVGDRVEYLGLVGTDAVQPVMAAADAGISTHQGGVFGDLYFSNKLLEYMTQGLPVLTSRTRTVARILPEETAFFFAPGDAASCAAAIRRVSREPGLVRRRLANARRFAGDFNWRTESRTLLDFYSRCLERRRSRALGRPAA